MKGKWEFWAEKWAGPSGAEAEIVVTKSEPVVGWWPYTHMLTFDSGETYLVGA